MKMISEEQTITVRIKKLMFSIHLSRFLNRAAAKTMKIHIIQNYFLKKTKKKTENRLLQNKLIFKASTSRPYVLFTVHAFILEFCAYVLLYITDYFYLL